MRIAITRNVSPSFNRCQLTHLARAPIDLALAGRQHEAYARCLSDLGCELRALAAAADHPDAVFVEDTAVVLDELAIITRPGAPSRRGETDAVAVALRPHRELVRLTAPAVLDGGDVLVVGKTLFVGLSGRSDGRGFEQLTRAVSAHGYVTRAVDVRGCLHLKSAVTLVGTDALLINPEWVAPETFSGRRLIQVDPSEPMAANALLVEDTVVYPSAFPRTLERMTREGLRLRLVDVSELAKAEGGVTCCSLLFRARP